MKAPFYQFKAFLLAYGLLVGQSAVADQIAFDRIPSDETLIYLRQEKSIDEIFEQHFYFLATKEEVVELIAVINGLERNIDSKGKRLPIGTIITLPGANVLKNLELWMLKEQLDIKIAEEIPDDLGAENLENTVSQDKEVELTPVGFNEDRKTQQRSIEIAKIEIDQSKGEASHTDHGHQEILTDEKILFCLVNDYALSDRELIQQNIHYIAMNSKIGERVESTAFQTSVGLYLESNGYPEYSFQKNESTQELYLDIGERHKIGKVFLNYVAQADANLLKEIEVNEFYSEQLVNALRYEIENALYEQGYFNTEILRIEQRASRNAYRDLDVYLDIRKKIEISGIKYSDENKLFSERYTKLISPFKREKTISKEKLAILKNKIIDTGFYENIIFEVSQQDEKNALLLVDADRISKSLLELDFSYDGNTQLSVVPNVEIGNLTKNADTLRVSTIRNQLINSSELNYSIDGLFSSESFFNLKAQVGNEDNNYYISDSKNIAVEYESPIRFFKDIDFEAKVNLARSSYEENAFFQFSRYDYSDKGIRLNFQREFQKKLGLKNNKTIFDLSFSKSDSLNLAGKDYSKFAAKIEIPFSFKKFQFNAKQWFSVIKSNDLSRIPKASHLYSNIDSQNRGYSQMEFSSLDLPSAQRAMMYGTQMDFQYSLKNKKYLDSFGLFLDSTTLNTDIGGSKNYLAPGLIFTKRIMNRSFNFVIGMPLTNTTNNNLNFIVEMNI